MLCKRDVSVSHNLCGKGLWEEQLSGGQIRLLLCLNFHRVSGHGPKGDAACVTAFVQLTLEELQLAPAMKSVLRVQSHGPWGRFGDSVGQVRPREALPRSLAGKGSAFGKQLWQAGGCESSSHEVFPQEQSEYKHGSSLRHERGLVREGGSSRRVQWGREAGEACGRGPCWVGPWEGVGGSWHHTWQLGGAVSAGEEGLG